MQNGAFGRRSAYLLLSAFTSQHEDTKSAKKSVAVRNMNNDWKYNRSNVAISAGEMAKLLPSPGDTPGASRRGIAVAFTLARAFGQVYRKLNGFELLFTRPRRIGALAPIIDATTRKMAASYRAATPSNRHYFGWHECICGARSRTFNFYIPNGRKVNSLCVHYLAFHRDEVSILDLVAVDFLADGEVEPNAEELWGLRPVDINLNTDEENRRQQEQRDREYLERTATAREMFDRLMEMRREEEQRGPTAKRLSRWIGLRGD